jgi:hypothetical protein
MKTRCNVWISLAAAALVWTWSGPAAAEPVDATVSASVSADGEVSTDTKTANEEKVEKPSEPVSETTLDLCQDGVDNDNDSHIDCSDQDCEIYAMCVADSKDEPAAAAPAGPVTRVAIIDSNPVKEYGRFCRDGVDNDENGSADCHDPQCQSSYYCRKEMYYYPEDNTRPPGLFVSFGLGLALPNYRYPHAETDSIYGRNISFDPDLGGMLDFQVGFMFLKYLGAGFNFKSAFTGGSNRDEQIFSEQSDEDYKYLGFKYWGNVGGFVRAQWPFERVVPYVNVHMGFSSARHRWHVYDAENTWSDVYDYESDDSEYIEGERDEKKSGAMRHFTFAFEPGFDVFVAKRLFGIGLKVWLPVVASSDSETDNVGVMANFTFTPQWRGKKQLKDEYKNTPAPASSKTPSKTTGE